MYQKRYFTLPTQTFATASGDLGKRFSIPLRGLPKHIDGRPLHLVAIIFANSLTPTTTALPTVLQTNNLVTSLEFWDGEVSRFTGSFNHLRMFERLENGGLRLPDPDADTASGTARHFRRIMYMGPPQGIGAPTDFSIPTALLENAEVRGQFATALTDFASDCTDATGQVQAIAVCIQRDEIGIPPVVQYGYKSLTASQEYLQGRALYHQIALLNSGSFDAITAGDFGNVSLDMGQGKVLTAIPAHALTAAYAADWGRGDFDSIQGEPAVAADTSAKRSNHASVAAVTDEAADLQPVIWMPNGGKITKLYGTGSTAEILWSGSQSTAVLLYGRLLEQGQDKIKEKVAIVARQFGRGVKSLSPKTVSKETYRGVVPQYMPHVAKFA